MKSENSLFAPEELMQFQAIVKHHMNELRNLPLLTMYCVLQIIAFVIIGIIEWEIIYEVFVYISGEDEGYWAPELMGCTALIMIIGFHLLAKSNPNNLAVRLINAAVQILIPLYLLGVGFLIAAIMYGDGLGSMIETTPEIIFGGLPQEPDQNWIEWAMLHLASPAAILSFSIGIGGLAIVNIFVAHQLLTRIGKNIDEGFQRTSRAREALKDHAIIKRTHREFSEASIELAALSERDDAALRLMIANDVLAIMAEALLPHKLWLKEQELNVKPVFGSSNEIDPKLVAKEVAKIEAITLAQVLAALNPKLLEKKS